MKKLIVIAGLLMLSACTPEVKPQTNADTYMPNLKGTERP